MYDNSKYVRGQALSEARMSAWAILLGTHNMDADRRRPHRGMLPDVIFDVPRPPRRSLVEKLAGVVGALRSLWRPAEASAPDALTASLGESGPVAYIDEARAERAESVARGTTGTRAA